MRLAAKINMISVSIFTLLIAMVAYATQIYLARAYYNEMNRNLENSESNFNLIVQNLCENQMAEAVRQCRQTEVVSSLRERRLKDLHRYLHTAQEDLNVDCFEILDEHGNLLADGDRYYEDEQNLVPMPEKTLGEGDSFLALQSGDLFLMTAALLETPEGRAGYVCIGKRFDRTYLDYLSSMLHGEIVFLSPDAYLAGTLEALDTPPDLFASLAETGKPVFAGGLSSSGREKYDFVFFSMPSTPPISVLAGIGLNHGAITAALARTRFFLILLAMVGLVPALAGSYILTRIIKRSIFDMEPDEIASALNERAAILQSMFEGVVAVDRTGTITSINPEAQRFWPRENAIVGREIAELLPDVNLAQVLDSGLALYNQQHILGETVAYYNIVPVKVQNSSVGAIITLRDLTEFQMVSTELMELKSYAQALRAQSHEFINKLQTVSGLIQLERYEEALMQLHETAQSHQELVTFLMRAFPGSNIPGILLGKFNRANELNVRFHLDPGSGIKTSAGLPEIELVCIIGNFIENALDALKESEQAEKDIWIKIKERRSFLSILVADNGPGIRRAIRNRIFERGFTTKVGQSMGLGLSLVRQYVANLHGSIVIHSDRLTVFLVRIPMAQEGDMYGSDKGDDRRGQSAHA